MKTRENRGRRVDDRVERDDSRSAFRALQFRNFLCHRQAAYVLLTKQVKPDENQKSWLRGSRWHGMANSMRRNEKRRGNERLKPVKTRRKSPRGNSKSWPFQSQDNPKWPQYSSWCMAVWTGHWSTWRGYIARPILLLQFGLHICLSTSYATQYSTVRARFIVAWNILDKWIIPSEKWIIAFPRRETRYF